MLRRERKIAINRTQALLETDPLVKSTRTAPKSHVDEQVIPEDKLRLLLYHANVSMPVSVLVLISLVLGCGVALMFSRVLSVYFLPLFFIAGAVIPFMWLEGRASKRAAEFASDYPTLLLATASSIKVGMTAHIALERAVRLLDEKSLVRREVEQLLADLQQGNPKAAAIRRFGASIRQPDLSLFRSAFLLVLEQGGRFAPTLERLATVSRDRVTLINSAHVSTTTMRMTANILLAIAPIILFVVSLRTENYWDLFINHPVANLIASIGIVLISFSYAVLRHMSNFKP